MIKIMLMAVLVMVFAWPIVAQTVQVGDVAPDFTVVTLRGVDFSLHDTVEDSIVVLYFMGYS